MDAQTKAVARLFFRYKLHTSDGTAFEKIFTELMQFRHKGFIQIKPYGNVGDRKNDGCIPESGVYYQVFAPEDIRKAQTSVDAVSKLDTDLTGLIGHWSKTYPKGIVEFYFVINDKFYNAPAPVIMKLQELKTKHSLSECGVMTDKDLENFLMECEEDQIISLVGFIPSTEVIAQIDYDDISQVVGFILQNKPSKVAAFRTTPPDFQRKIEFNGLRVADRLLRDAEYLISTIEQYFEDKGGNFQKYNIQNRLKELYEESKSVAFESTEDYTENDLRFLYILDKVRPTARDSSQMADLEMASLGMMAVFFETCHIFEEPPLEAVTAVAIEESENVST